LVRLAAASIALVASSVAVSSSTHVAFIVFSL
jgi:hypothetical protein